MATYTYPGVYVEEIPPQVRPIAGVGTSTAAFLGLAEKGVISEPVKLFNFQAFKTEFGDFLTDSYLAHAVFHFFNNGGRECYVIRLGPGATSDSWKFVNDDDVNCLDVETQSPSELQLTVEAEIPTGNLTTDDLNLFTLKVYEGTPANATTSLGADPANTPLETHENLSMSPRSPNYVGFVTARSEYIAVEDVAPGPIGDDVDFKGYTQGEPLQALLITTADTHRKLQVRVDSAATSVVATVELPNTTDIGLGDIEGLLRTALSASGLPAVTVTFVANAVKITAVTPDKDSRIAVLSVSDPNEDAAGLLGFVGSSVVEYYGASANRPKVDAAISDPADDPGLQVPPRTDGDLPRSIVTSLEYDEALGLLDGIDDVSLIAIPGEGETDVADVAMNYCRNRQLSDCFFIADMAEDQTELADAEEWRGLVNASDYGAAYFPWLRMVDPKADTPEAGPIGVPPSGYVAGIYARTDEARGVWKAPAGIAATVAGTLGVVTELTDQQHGNLNVGDKAIDVIRRFPNVGTVVWGARTLAMESDPHRYIPVRRTAIFLKRSIYNGIQWAVFEPNGEQLWASLRANVGAFMNGLFRAGAFQGGRASEAYFVECGKDRTMTQADIDLGKVIVEVGFAPLKPAEFVIVRIQQIVQQ